ncbi:MFS transporter [Herbaspirillum sp. alder98]|uniref:MFS transporter n=1 Tax=Herbaspirillum sp. alder98 TaxID=2913096 RepID=UPI001CD8CACA|nr:MFS transporter [Herbaspirillum sp. alder98]MCA1325998.1 MFS transporter [Herbaspirillum sp. alder98]
MPIALWALTISAFAIGTTEFVIMGLLPEVAASLGVTLSAAGMLVTGYALGVFVGAPLVTATTGRLPRKTLLMALMVVFVIGNLACALAPDYNTLMIGRIIASFAHGAFFGVGSVVATGLVPKEKQASAIALMFTGLTVANVLGVPFGTWLGQMYGWRATFWAVTAIGVVALAATGLLVPRSQGGEPADFGRELRVLGRPQVLLGLAMTVLGFGGVFAAFTYIAPILTDISGFAPAAVSPILLLFGVGLVIGNLAGGKLSDRRLMPTLVGSLIALAVVLVLFGLTNENKIASIIGVGLLGMAAFATVPPLQMRVLEKATGAPNLASSVNIAAFNLGNAAGAWLGGLTIDHGPGLHAVPYVAAILPVAGIAVALVSWRMDKPAPLAATRQQQAR